MRRLCRLITEAVLLTTLALGCGSSAEDSAVMRFVGIDGDNIIQADTVTATSAVICVNDPSRPDLRVRPPTLINASFVNEEKTNIHLTSYTVRFNDASSGVAEVTADIPGNPDLIGGLCTDGFTSCASSGDCLATGGGGGSESAASCNHLETSVGGLVLIDGTAKQHLNPKLYGQTLSMTLTFVGEDDANRTFVVDAGYAVVFSDSPLLCLLTGEASPTAAPEPTFTPTPLPTAILATPVV